MIKGCFQRYFCAHFQVKRQKGEDKYAGISRYGNNKLIHGGNAYWIYKNMDSRRK